jgi:uncharacterized protein (TIGR02597 family)
MHFSNSLIPHGARVAVGLLLSGASLNFAAAQVSVTTDPVGFTTTSLLGSSDNFVSIPFTRPPEFIGRVASITMAGAITVTSTPWSPSQFKYVQGTQSKHYYALIGLGAGTKEGRTYPIIDNTNNSLNVMITPFDDASGIPANTQVEIIPYWTPATIFPASNAGVSFTPTTVPPTYQTLLRVPDYTAATYDSPPAAEYYFSGDSNTGHWQRVNPAGIGDDDPLLPDGYFVVRNNNGAPTRPLTNIGAVLLKKLSTMLASATNQNHTQDNPVSVVRPVGVGLDATGLGPADNSFGSGDRLLLFNNGVAAIGKSPSSTYYYDTAAPIPGWRLIGDTTSADRGADIIPSGTGFVIRKASGALNAFWTNRFPVSAVSAVSRKLHGNGVGNMDILLPLSGAPGIECRDGGLTQIIVTFPTAVTVNGTLGTQGARVTSGLGSVSSVSGSGTNTLIVNLTGVTSQQWITLTLYEVSDGTYTNDVAIRAGVLLADVNASSNVDSADVTLAQRQNNKTVTGSNFRMDVNASGNIDSADVALTQRQNQKRLP